MFGLATGADVQSGRFRVAVVVAAAKRTQEKAPAPDTVGSHTSRFVA
jgi:hypothetical protein